MFYNLYIVGVHNCRVSARQELSNNGLFLFLFQYIRTCVSKGVRPVLSLVLRSSLQVEVLDMSGRSHFPRGSVPPLPQKTLPATLSLWNIETHVRIKIVSAANVNAGDLMKVCQLFCSELCVIRNLVFLHFLLAVFCGPSRSSPVMTDFKEQAVMGRRLPSSLLSVH